MSLSRSLCAFGVLSFLTLPAAAQDSDAASGTGEDPFEIGVFGGGIWLQGREEQVGANIGAESIEYEKAGVEAGLRLGAYPIRYLGIEVEGAAVGSKAVDDSYGFIGIGRGQLIGQLPLGIIAPFVLAGAGVIGADCPPGGCESEVQGRDRELGVHFGVGAKLGLTRHFHLRLDVRDTIAGGDHLPEGLLTVGFSFGRPEPERKPFIGVDADSDGDGLIDKDDKCPREPADTPDGCPIVIGDRDGDGKKDDVDQCPDEPSELPDGCPDLDPDKDGIKGSADKCPDVAGIKPDGCPDPDPDKDGIEGKADKCPNTAETVNGFEDEDGCPDKKPPPVEKFSGVVEGITFDKGKATIRPSSYPILEEALATLKEFPEIELRISGHTDSQGAPGRNRELSLARAQSVANYFASRGIDRSRLTTVGHGPDKPIADNSTEDGRRQNRRIEFDVVQ